MFVALAAALLALAPSLDEPNPADLCVITIEPNSDFSHVVVRVDEIYDEEAKERFARDVDADGNGNITAIEVSSYENESRVVVFDEARGDPVHNLGPRNLFLDDQLPTRFQLETDLTNVEGPRDDRADWLITEVRSYAFTPERLPTHRLQGGNQSSPEPRAVVEFVVVKAPPSWLVHRINGTVYDEPTVTLPAFDTRRFYVIDFADREGLDHRLPVRGDGIPWPAALGLVGLGAAAILRRRSPAA